MPPEIDSGTNLLLLTNKHNFTILLQNLPLLTTNGFIALNSGH